MTNLSTKEAKDIASEALHDGATLIGMAKAYLQQNGFISAIDSSG